MKTWVVNPTLCSFIYLSSHCQDFLFPINSHALSFASFMCFMLALSFHRGVFLLTFSHIIRIRPNCIRELFSSMRTINEKGKIPMFYCDYMRPPPAEFIQFEDGSSYQGKEFHLTHILIMFIHNAFKSSWIHELDSTLMWLSSLLLAPYRVLKKYRFLPKGNKDSYKYIIDANDLTNISTIERLFSVFLSWTYQNFEVYVPSALLLWKWFPL